MIRQWQWTHQDLEKACEIVYSKLRATPQFEWPLLSKRLGCKVWVKHENHHPVGAFKVRGGLTYLQHLLDVLPQTTGLVSATRGNHGQSLAYACQDKGIPFYVFVPTGNCTEKNAAMEALGARVVVAGTDFQESVELAKTFAAEQALHFVPSFHEALVLGVATYAYEFLSACPDLKVIYSPIGQGSGVCALLMMKELLQHPAEIVGVVTERAPAYFHSWQEGLPTHHEVSPTIADGLACRSAHPEAFALMKEKGLSRVVTVCEDRVKEAMAIYFSDTHNVAEGAGAAGLAAFLNEQHHYRGAEVGLVLTGGNVGSSTFADVLKVRSERAAQEKLWI